MLTAEELRHAAGLFRWKEELDNANGRVWINQHRTIHDMKFMAFERNPRWRIHENTVTADGMLDTLQWAEGNGWYWIIRQTYVFIAHGSAHDHREAQVSYDGITNLPAAVVTAILRAVEGT